VRVFPPVTMKSLILVAVFITLSLAQNRPQVSEVFTGKVKIEVKERERTLFGDGVYIMNQPEGKGVERYVFPGHPTYDHHLLQRFDLNLTFTIGRPSNHSHCKSHKVDGTMPSVWGWVAQSDYKGRKHYHGRDFDVWEFTGGFATMWIAVDPSAPNTPVWVGRNSSHKEVNLHFQEFNTNTPDPNHFKVPHNCQQIMLKGKTSRAGCVPRSTMISRGQVWVDRNVPYNQGGTYDGYREDCSGYVSMCWETSKPGYTTFTMPQIAHEISKGELQPGDVLLDTSEHVVLFKGWADGAHSQYVAMEETKPGEGTVERQTPYPYWYNQAAFIPYRFNKVC